MPKDAIGSNGDPCRSLKDVLERARCLGSVSASFGKAAQNELGTHAYSSPGWAIRPEGSKDQKKCSRAQILRHSWYLGPKALMFGSLDPYI